METKLAPNNLLEVFKKFLEWSKVWKPNTWHFINEVIISSLAGIRLKISWEGNDMWIYKPIDIFDNISWYSLLELHLLINIVGNKVK